MSHTPFFGRLRRALRLAHLANQPGAPPVDELVEMARARRTRRDVLKAAVAAGAAAGLDGTAAYARRAQPRIAIVGGGVAGLNAAYTLKKAGVNATVYEGSNRIGGRMYTVNNLVADGIHTEIGGEFIDSGHRDIRRLAREFGLVELDTEGPGEADLVKGYYFDGEHHSVAQVVAEFRPAAERMQPDINRLSNLITFRHHRAADKALDNLSLATYLDRLQMTRWLQKLLNVAYVTEYGLDSEEQSAINFLFLIGTDTSDGKFRIFGDSDERYKLAGGNGDIITGLANRLVGRIRTGHRLEALRKNGQAYRLTFEVDGQGPVDVDADIVLMCIPFTILRNVDLQLPLPEFKRRAINQLGYGTNAKVMAGFNARLWRDQGFTGELFTDEPLQLGWDSSRLQPGKNGSYTFYSGGTPGVDVGSGTPEDQLAFLLPGLEAAYPGVTAARNGSVERFHWPTYPFTLASYSCFRPGQWTTIAGSEILPIGRLFFAGEHTSYNFQGYMNGGAETGRRAAEAILAKSFFG